MGNTFVTLTNVISLIESRNNRIPFVSLSTFLFCCSLSLAVCIRPNHDISFSNVLGIVRNSCQLGWQGVMPTAGMPTSGGQTSQKAEGYLSRPLCPPTKSGIVRYSGGGHNGLLAGRYAYL